MTQVAFIIIGYIIFIIYHFLLSTCHYCLSSLFTVQVYYYALFFCLFVRLFSFFLSFFLSFCLSTFTCLFIQLFICLFVCLFVCSINFMFHHIFLVSKSKTTLKKPNKLKPNKLRSNNGWIGEQLPPTKGDEINGCFIQRNCRMGGQV